MDTITSLINTQISKLEQLIALELQDSEKLDVIIGNTTRKVRVAGNEKKDFGVTLNFTPKSETVKTFCNKKSLTSVTITNSCIEINTKETMNVTAFIRRLMELQGLSVEYKMPSNAKVIQFELNKFKFDLVRLG